uniref:Replication protein n=1 Tax=Cruciviridae sp. TaxID=1955495 RepID=A0A1S6LVH5_9VIRU|nr:replication protein [Cruciviridae sp.]
MINETTEKEIAEIIDEYDPKKQGRCWIFTVNNYLPQEMELLLESDKFDYVCFGEEIGEKCGTPHLQGFFELSCPLQWKTVINRVAGVLGREQASIRPMAKGSNRWCCISYCKKGEQLKTEWDLLKTNGPNYGKNVKFHEKQKGKPHCNQGKRTDWIRVRDSLNLEPDYGKFCQTDPENAIKFHNGIKAFIQAREEIKMKEDLEKEYENVNLLEWQQQLANEIKYSPINQRLVTWYYDKRGNSGKSWMAKYMVSRGDCAYFNNGSTSDIVYAYKNERTVVFDFSRKTEGTMNYGVIERIKDGMMFSAKYQSTRKCCARPRVICFANFMPDLTSMSLDRWDIRVLDNIEVPTDTEKVCSLPASCGLGTKPDVVSIDSDKDHGVSGNTMCSPPDDEKITKLIEEIL